MRFLSPATKWSIEPQIKSIRGAIIVCNHLSYLDPLLFTSLLPRNKSIVKATFFSAPVFGFIIGVAGYLPSTTEEKNGTRMIAQMETMNAFFASGGTLFVFPEGTRSGDAPLQNGVFKIARMHKTPIEIYRLRGTDRLFPPGKFLFNSCQKNEISLRRVDSISMDSSKGKISVAAIRKKVSQAFGGQQSNSG